MYLGYNGSVFLLIANIETTFGTTSSDYIYSSWSLRDEHVVPLLSVFLLLLLLLRVVKFTNFFVEHH